ncbi:MAG: hypothetical protein NC935_02215 [Candidatus Omnitrophica bacterium]|nr:hypothetical protein [Candidatus Omnitrophota bacterium]
MKLKANFLTILKGSNLIVILIREDKKVLFNFGSEEWFDFYSLYNYDGFIKNNKFKEDFEETKEVIEKAKDYNEITEKFIKDFKADRGNKIVLNRAELEV